MQLFLRCEWRGPNDRVRHSRKSGTLTINSASGPNGDTPENNQRRRADNRLPLLPDDLAASGRRHAWLRRTQALEILHGRRALCRISLRRIPDRLRQQQHTSDSDQRQPEGATVFANAPAGYTWPPQTAAFTATVTNNTNTAVTWSVTPSTGGTIDANGNYTAPAAVEGLPTSATVTATSQADYN